MYLAGMPSIQNSRSLLRAFGGLNETYGCTEAEYSAGVNFSSRDFPALSTRTPRRRLREATALNGMYQLNGLLLVCGQDIIYLPEDEDAEELMLAGAVSDGEKALVGLGTKILIFPDKLAFDTADGTLTALGASWNGEGLSVTITPCDADGNTYTVDSWGTEEPEDPADGQVFLLVESEASPWRYDGALEVYSAELGKWSTILLNYCRISAAGIGAELAKWDTVTLSGTAAQTAGMYSELDGEQVIYARDENWIRIQATPDGERFYGMLTQSGGTARWQSLDGSTDVQYTGVGTVTVERRVPDLDFLTECDNRVWGCSSSENVIYACKLGDPTNWFSYRSTAADSYAVTVGSDGPFTGAATCMGYALFFKENAMHKLYGTKPADFQLTSLRCRGVARQAAKSLCVISETLYYLSADGVMAWDGSLPVKVSGALDPGGLANARRAVSGQLDGRYYLHISLADSARLLVYDTERGLWHEESVCSYEMAGTGRQLYMWDGQALWAADPSRETDSDNTDGLEEKISFELVTGDIGLDEPEDQYLARLMLRLEAEAGTTLKIAASYDGDIWETLYETAVGGERKKLLIPLAPRRHDTMRLRLQGAGQITLRSLSRTYAAAKGGLTR